MVVSVTPSRGSISYARSDALHRVACRDNDDGDDVDGVMSVTSSRGLTSYASSDALHRVASWDNDVGDNVDGDERDVVTRIDKLCIERCVASRCKLGQRRR